MSKLAAIYLPNKKLNILTEVFSVGTIEVDYILLFCLVKNSFEIFELYDLSIFRDLTQLIVPDCNIVSLLCPIYLAAVKLL